MVLPSICLETFGSTIVEAFSCGRPAIVSDLGSPSELVRNGWNGYKVPPSDSGALAKALETALFEDTLVDELGRNGRQDYLASFTPDVNFHLLRRIYEFALQHPQGAAKAAPRPNNPATTQAQEAECRA
jgi:glycosyltransferase involved in cell wall biosynthesis